MRGSHKTLRLTAGIAAVTLFATACGGDDGSSGSEEQGDTMVVQIGDPQHLLPSNTNESEGAAVLQAVYSTLITYDPETKKLAEVKEVDKRADARLIVESQMLSLRLRSKNLSQQGNLTTNSPNHHLRRSELQGPSARPILPTRTSRNIHEQAGLRKALQKSRKPLQPEGMTKVSWPTYPTAAWSEPL